MRLCKSSEKHDGFGIIELSLIKGGHISDNVWPNSHNRRNSMAKEPVGRIGTAFHISGSGRCVAATLAMESPPVGDRELHKRTLRAATPPTRGFPKPAARLPGVHSYNHRDVTLGRVQETGVESLTIIKVSVRGELSQENQKKSGPQVLGGRRDDTWQLSGVHNRVKPRRAQRRK